MNVREMALRVISRFAEAMSELAYHASTTVRSRPKAKHCNHQPDDGEQAAQAGAEDVLTMSFGDHADAAGPIRRSQPRCQTAHLSRCVTCRAALTARSCVTHDDGLAHFAVELLQQCQHIDRAFSCRGRPWVRQRRSAWVG